MKKALAFLIGGFVTEMHRAVRGLIDMWLGATRRGEHNLITGTSELIAGTTVSLRYWPVCTKAPVLTSIQVTRADHQHFSST